VQLMRQRQTAANRPILSCQAADIAEGLAFDHCPYNAIIDKVSGHMIKERTPFYVHGLRQAEHPATVQASRLLS